MKSFVVMLAVLMLSPLYAQETKSANLRQYYSGKFGYYQPGKELNNGLMFGVDGVTEFIHYNLTLTGAIDFYQKQTISVYKNSDARNVQQAVVLIPLHASVGYKLVEIPDADTRVYAGAGLGYNLFFYNVQYTETSSSGPLGGVVSRDYAESKNGGQMLGTAFLRVLIGRIFVESRYYTASKKQDKLGNGSYVIDPTGFAVTIGFQYQ